MGVVACIGVRVVVSILQSRYRYSRLDNVHIFLLRWLAGIIVTIGNNKNVAVSISHLRSKLELVASESKQLISNCLI